jgi:hypothetical protein
MNALASKEYFVTMPTDETIYHYCSSEAFAQIIRSKTLWLTDMFSTNDKEEHRWLRRIASEVIESERKQPSRDWDDATMRLLETVSIDTDETGEMYLACFSRRKDSIGQWCRYADDGRGITIGFSREYMLARQEEMGRDYFEVFDVEYDRSAQKKRVLEAIERAQKWRSEAVRNSPETEANDCDTSWWNGFIGKLWQYAPGCKHPGFEEEDEVRVVYFHLRRLYGEDHELPPRRDSVTKCHVLPIEARGDQQPFKEIRLGPKNTSSVPDVMGLVAESGYDAERIVFSKSDIPYRDTNAVV